MLQIRDLQTTGLLYGRCARHTKCLARDGQMQLM